MLWAAIHAGKALLNPDLGLAVVTAIVYALLRRPYGVGKAILGAIGVASLGAYLGQSVALGQGSRADLVHYVGDAARTANALHLPEFSARTFSTLFSPALALAVLVIIEGTANARASALKTGRGSDLHQEIFGLGMANPGVLPDGRHGRLGLDHAVRPQREQRRPHRLRVDVLRGLHPGRRLRGELPSWPTCRWPAWRRWSSRRNSSWRTCRWSD
ncbi:hypothetical protein EMGBS10_02460 [Opitutia bacterium]|nr:hypothetical protein EMGBS10_02460 [Opitutae bacterium]